MQAGLYDDIPHGRELVWIMLANRAARGLASLWVQANEIGLDEAGKFHAAWTPRGWSDASSKLVRFDALLFLREQQGRRLRAAALPPPAGLRAELYRRQDAARPFARPRVPSRRA